MCGINGFNFKDLELIAITRGPGSYTGVRVGLAVAKGLSIGLNIPIIGISSLQILATEVAINIQEKKDIICVNKARADELFFQEFKSNGAQSSVPKKIKKKTLVSIVENREVIITGNFVDELGEIIFESDIAIYKNNPSKFSPSNLIVNFVSSIIEKNDSFSNYPYDPIYLNSIKWVKSLRL